jgi:hypothetical protein
MSTFIRDNIGNDDLESKINSQRDEFLCAIRECEAFNMKHLLSAAKSGEKKSILSGEDLFPKFCFLVKLCDNEQDKEKESARNCFDLPTLFRHRLIVTDRYLSENQIKCFRVLIDLPNRKGYSLSLEKMLYMLCIKKR